MNSDLVFDFRVDKAAQKVFITREFDADLPLVWSAFTTQEILDQWIAPAPFTARTKHMDFKVGGKRFYAMVSPDGNESWALQTYTSITPMTNFKLFNVFADAEENPQPPGSDWDYNFSEANGRTTVHIEIYNESLERMERIMDGFKAGFAMSLENLDKYFATHKK